MWRVVVLVAAAALAVPASVRGELLQSASSAGQPAASSAGQPAASSAGQPAASSAGQPAASSAGQPAASSAGQAYHEPEGVPLAARLRAEEQAPPAAASRIVGGLASYTGEHPYYGGLVIELTSGLTSVCGASLVSHTRAVTAAHCYWDGHSRAASMLLVLGSARLFAGGARLAALSITTHPAYDPASTAANIAVLAIPYVAYTSYVKPVVLPSGSQLTSSWAGYQAEAMGFGRTSDSSPITTDQSLRDVFVNVLSNEACAAVYGEPTVNGGVLCTSGAGARGVCGGDAGGPLVLRRYVSGDDLLVGIVSFWSASGCGAGYPSGYTRVSAHAAWLQANL